MPPKKISAAPAKKATGKANKSGAAKKPQASKPAASKPEEPKQNPPVEVTAAVQEMKLVDDVEIGLKEISDVMNNKNERVNQSNRWPLVIDSMDRVSVFLRHRDCNHLDALDQAGMQPDKIRLALLGSIRFGKPLVIDLMGSDVWSVVETGFQNVQPGLLESVLDKSILQEDKFFTLVDVDQDDPMYTQLHQYSPTCIENFVFIVLTTQDNVPDSLKRNTITLRIV